MRELRPGTEITDNLEDHGISHDPARSLHQISARSDQEHMKVNHRLEIPELCIGSTRGNPELISARSNETRTEKGYFANLDAIAYGLTTNIKTLASSFSEMGWGGQKHANANIS